MSQLSGHNDDNMIISPATATTNKDFWRKVVLIFLKESFPFSNSNPFSPCYRHKQKICKDKEWNTIICHFVCKKVRMRTRCAVCLLIYRTLDPNWVSSDKYEHLLSSPDRRLCKHIICVPPSMTNNKPKSIVVVVVVQASKLIEYWHGKNLWQTSS